MKNKSQIYSLKKYELICIVFLTLTGRDEVIQYSIEKVIEAELKATIFATHDSHF